MVNTQNNLTSSRQDRPPAVTLCILGNVIKARSCTIHYCCSDAIMEWKLCIINPNLCLRHPQSKYLSLNPAPTVISFICACACANGARFRQEHGVICFIHVCWSWADPTKCRALLHTSVTATAFHALRAHHTSLHQHVEFSCLINKTS